ncbi:MAG TPA: hypothetical protein VGW38_22640 [Chloroflexota bacterium]|nr:hypothetical protein [Chloroflexota bacterium]
MNQNQARAITALLSSPTIREAAEAAGVTERTIHRYMQEPAFQAALREAEGRAIDDAVRQLVGLASDAIETLRMILANPKVSPSVRLRAAAGVLDFMMRMREVRNVEQRLSRLEEQIGQGNGS